MNGIGELFYDWIAFLASTACVLHLYYKLLILKIKKFQELVHRIT